MAKMKQYSVQIKVEIKTAKSNQSKGGVTSV